MKIKVLETINHNFSLSVNKRKEEIFKMNCLIEKKSDEKEKLKKKHTKIK